MSELVLMPTELAQFHALVQEGAMSCNHNLDDEAESYLVFALMRTLRDDELLERTLGIEFFKHATQGTSAYNLRNIGDSCLIFSGLFPGMANRRLVSLNYFMRIGVSAYNLASDRIGTPEYSRLYAKISQQFVELVDVLQSLRHLDDSASITLAEVEFWQNYQSRRVYDKLSKEGKFTGFIPKTLN